MAVFWWKGMILLSLLQNILQLPKSLHYERFIHFQTSIAFTKSWSNVLCKFSNRLKIPENHEWSKVTGDRVWNNFCFCSDTDAHCIYCKEYRFSHCMIGFCIFSESLPPPASDQSYLPVCHLVVCILLQIHQTSIHEMVFLSFWKLCLCLFYQSFSNTDFEAQQIFLLWIWNAKRIAIVYVQKPFMTATSTRWKKRW